MKEIWQRRARNARDAAVVAGNWDGQDGWASGWGDRISLPQTIRLNSGVVKVEILKIQVEINLADGLSDRCTYC